MLTTLAHAGHTHTMTTMSGLDHCMPIIIGAGIVIAVLVGVIIYLLTARKSTVRKQPTTPTDTQA